MTKKIIHLEKITKKYNIKFIVGFGSYFEKPEIANDIDIAIWGNDIALLKNNYFSIISELNEIFNEKNIDVVILNFADPLLLKNIALHSKLLYGNNLDYEKFYLYAIDRYYDYKPMLDEESIAVEKILEKIK